MYWNADGIRLKIDELMDLLLDLSIDIVAISETRLSPNACLDTPGYTLYRQDKHANGKGQGVAILIKHNIVHSVIKIPLTKVLEAIGVQVTVSESKIVIISAYQSPNTELVTGDIDLLFNLGSKVIIVGDFNACHHMWHCPFINARGKKLEEYLLNNDYSLYAPTNPTLVHYVDNYRPTTPDLCLTKNVYNLSELRTISALSSNHLPVVFDFFGSVESSSVTRFDFSKADWKGFRNHLNSNTLLTAYVSETSNDIDASILKLTESLTLARDKFVPVKNVHQSPKNLPRFIKKLIKDRNRLRKFIQSEQNPTTRSIMRATIIGLQLKIKLALQNNNDRTWDKKLRSVDNPSSDIWRLIKSTCTKRDNTIIPPLYKPDGTVATSTLEICITLANGFHSNMLLTGSWSSPIENEVQSSINIINSYQASEMIQIVHPNEVWKQLRNLKCRKSPGADNIHNTVLKNLPQKSVVLLTKIFNDCLRLNYFPPYWKIAKVIALKKPGKTESIPSSYRPISLLPTLSKLFERLILIRLARFTNKFIIDEQFGFRPRHSTVQQLARVTEHIAHMLNKNCSTGMFLLDVEKAFDTVWHDGLLHKMLLTGVPIGLVRLIQSYLQGRFFRVHISNTSSDEYTVPAGVPQGSVLGPYLFLLYLNDIPKQPHTQLACFADDTATFTSSADIDLTISRLQLAIELVSEFFKKWKLKLNASKTEAILFTRKRS